MSAASFFDYKDGAVVSLIPQEFQIAQALQQIIAAHVGHIAVNSRQNQNDPGVILRFRLVVNCPPYVRFRFSKNRVKAVLLSESRFVALKNGILLISGLSSRHIVFRDTSECPSAVLRQLKPARLNEDSFFVSVQ